MPKGVVFLFTQNENMKNIVVFFKISVTFIYFNVFT